MGINPYGSLRAQAFQTIQQREFGAIKNAQASKVKLSMLLTYAEHILLVLGYLSSIYQPSCYTYAISLKVDWMLFLSHKSFSDTCRPLVSKEKL